MARQSQLRALPVAFPALRPLCRHAQYDALVDGAKQIFEAIIDASNDGLEDKQSDFDKLDINEGMIMENIVAQMLRRNGHKLYFYSRNDSEDKDNKMEIDFLISENRKISPVEVKSSNYRAHSSLDKFRKKFKGKIGTPYILYTKDVMEKDGVWHLPLYMAMFL